MQLDTKTAICKTNDYVIQKVSVSTLFQTSTNTINSPVFAGGCQTYKKTLSEKEKHLSTPVKAKKAARSRKQRVSAPFQ